MLVTAQNKMRSARPIQQSYAGELLQTVRFRLNDPGWLGSNLEATRRFLGRLGPPLSSNGDPPRSDADRRRPGWTGVPWEDVVAFLSQYATEHTASSFHGEFVAEYIRRQAGEFNELTRWVVTVRSQSVENPNLGSEDLAIAGVDAIACISRSRLAADTKSVGVLTSPPREVGNPWQGDEEFGLTVEQIERAREEVSNRAWPTLGHALRAERSPAEGLLMIFPVSRYSKATTKNRVDLFDRPDRFPTLVGVAVAFPFSKSPATVEYLVGPGNDAVRG
jgi:hypothetical protein